MKNKLEDKIQEGETRPLEKEETSEKELTEEELTEEKKVISAKPNKTKVEFYIELTLFFILGMLLGVAIKTEARKKITMGFDDYKMNIKSQDYNINQMQNDLIQKQIQEANQKAESQKLNKENKDNQ